MTANKHFKQLVRARAAATGESYSAARAHVLAAQRDVALNDPVAVAAHGRHGQTVTFTPDGTHVLSGGQDARVAILGAASGTVGGELLGHEKVVNAVAVLPNGRVAVSVSSDRTVRTWDLAGRSPLAVLEGHRDAVIALAVSPDGTHAVTGGYDGRLRWWDLRAGVCEQEVRSELRRIAAVAFTPDGAAIVESGQGPLAAVRDAGSGEVVATIDSGSPGVVGLAVAPDGAMVALGGYDGSVTLWETATWDRVRELVVGEPVHAVAFSRSGQLVAVASKGRVSLWGAEGDEPLAAVALPITGVYAVAFSPDGRRLAQTGADGKVRIWSLR